MEPWWQRDQIISAFIIGGFSMTATLVSILVTLRRETPVSRSRRRKVRRNALIARLVAMVVAGLVAGGLGYQVAGPVFSGLGAVIPGFVRSASDTSDAELVAVGDASSAEGGTGVAAHDATREPAAPGARVVFMAAADTAPAEAATAGSAEDAAAAARDPIAEAVASWLEADGTRIRLRYAESLPDACAGAVAVGNWPKGDEPGQPVQCGDDGWLAVDLEPLIRSGRITRNLTYCVAFRDAAGRAVEFAGTNVPGVDAVLIRTRRGTQAVGFRVLAGDGRDRIRFGGGFPRVPC